MCLSVWSVWRKAAGCSGSAGRRRIRRTSKDPVWLRRTIVVLMSAQGQTVKDVTSLMQVSEDYVRDVIHAYAFNERGFDALDPKWSGGRRQAISDRVCEHIRLIARTSPADWGLTGFATWSLSKLAAHLVERHVVPRISRETCGASCARARSPGRPPRRGRPPPTRTSLPRCTASWRYTTPRRPTAG
ncbi:helix-turn-helix domain-containing protein [Streptomyces sp. NPDC003442]